MTPSYDIFFYGPADDESIAANASARHLFQRKYCVTGLRTGVRHPANRFTHLLLASLCCAALALAGCGGAAIIERSTQAGSLSASPGSVNFGSVSVGTTATSNVALANKGSVPVQITQISVTGVAFTVSGASDLPLTIAAGTTYNLGVNFSPQATGTATSQLTIVSNASSGGTMVIGLNGTAIETKAPISLNALTCVNSSITGAGTDICTATLNAAAATGGFTVSLASDNSAVTTPTSVTVPAGATSASFIATAVAVSSAQTVTLTASANSVVQTFTLQLNLPDGPPPPVLNALTCGSASLTGAGTDSCTVTLSAAAATGGFTVSLASNNSVVTVPASVTVPAGATSANFTATAAAVSSAQTVTLTASANGIVQVFTLQLNAGSGGPPLAVLSALTCATNSIVGAGTDNCAVTLSAVAATGGFTVSLASNNSAVTTPTSVTVPAGATSANFTATAVAVGSAQIVTLTASANGVVETLALQLNVSGGPSSPALSALTCGSASLTGAGTDSCTVTLSAAAATGGFAVGLTSNSSAVTVPASVTVLAGATSANFTATAAAVSSAQTVTLTASAAGVSMTFALQLEVSTATLNTSASSLAFGNVNLNEPSTQTLTLSTTSILPLTVTAAIVAGPGYSVSGSTFPLSLTAGQTAILNVQFDPTVDGPATGTLTIISASLTNPTTVITLSGTGVSVSYDVDLSWDAPASSPDPVAGYNVYRSPSGASAYVQVNSSAVTQTTYVDTSVQIGQAYDYIVESVDASGVESVPSNVASVTIP